MRHTSDDAAKQLVAALGGTKEFAKLSLPQYKAVCAQTPTAVQKALAEARRRGRNCDYAHRARCRKQKRLEIAETELGGGEQLQAVLADNAELCNIITLQAQQLDLLQAVLPIPEAMLKPWRRD